MFQSHIGELSALLTAIFWSITALFFESASKKVGSLTVNIIRLLMAFVFLSIYNFIAFHQIFPTNVSMHSWIWLSLSGLIGFVIGDYFLFKSYVYTGARVSMLIMSLSPPVAALFAFIIMGETFSFMNFIGMLLTLSGIIFVIIGRENKNQEGKNNKKFKFNYSSKGLLLAFGGASGQAIGLVLSKYGMQDYNPFIASQVRVIAGMTGFIILFFILHRWDKVFSAVKNKNIVFLIFMGAFFGPFLGVSFSLMSVKYTGVGIASTIMAIVPILIIPLSVIFFKEKITFKDIIGTVVAVGGVAIFFIF